MGSLFGAHRGSAQVREGTDVVAPARDVAADAKTGREIDRVRQTFARHAYRVWLEGGDDRGRASTHVWIDSAWRNRGTTAREVG
jgi:hypothetical protein